jgi:hypothetical protein
MTDWRTHLRSAVEAGDDRLSADAARAMRRVVVAAARAEAGNQARVSSWKRPVALAATIILMIAVGITAGRRFDFSLPEQAGIADGVTDGAAVEHPAQPSRQLQFSTPGGTRIIWVFNSDLDLKATMP